MARKKKKQNRTASFEGVGKGFADGQEYLVQVEECTVEDGDSAPYLSFKLAGTGDFEGSYMYHNGSMSPSALWRTRELFEAFLGDVPEGEFDIDEVAEEFVGKYAMCSTFADTYQGTKRIKPDDFWAHEGDIPDGSSDGDDDEIDLDELEDADIKKIGKAMGIKSKRASTIRKELEDADAEELTEVLVDLGLVETSEGEGGSEDDFDLDELDDDQIKALAEAMDIKVTAKSRVKTLKKKLAALDEDDLAEAWENLSEEGDSGEDSSITADDIGSMSEDDLEELIEEHELEVDLDDYKTLRKKRAAVVDAAEEADILEED